MTTVDDDNESRNNDLADLHDMLVDKVSDLAGKIGKAADSKTAEALVTEMDEFNHRVILTGNMLFTLETKGITAGMDKVRAAETDIDNAIKSVDDLTKLVKGCTAFLALVDKVLDTAKLVAL